MIYQGLFSWLYCRLLCKRVVLRILFCIWTNYLIINLIVLIKRLFPVFLHRCMSFIQHSWALRGPENIGSWDLLEKIIAFSLFEGLHIVSVVVIIYCVQIARTALSFVILGQLRGLLFLVVVIVLYIGEG